MGRDAFWNRSLTVRLVLSFLILSLAIVSLVGIIAYFQATQYLTDSVYGRLDAVETLKESSLNNWIDDQTQNIVMIAWLPEVRTKAGILLSSPSPAAEKMPDCDEFSRFLQPEAIRSPYSDELFFIDMNGTIAASSDQNRIGQSVAEEPYFLQGRYTTTEVTVDPADVNITTAIFIATPVFDRQGKRIGVLASHVSVSRIDRVILERTGLGQSGETYLVDRSGRIVSESPLMKEGTSKRVVDSTGIHEALNGRDGSGLYQNYDGIPVIGVYRWVDNRDLALITEMSQAEAFKPARELALTLFYAGALLSILMAAGMYLLARQIARPVEEIAETAAAVAAGDLDRKAPVLTGDEIGRLAHAFNEMTTQLRQTLQGLEQNLRQLEERDLALEKSEYKYRTLVENIPQKIFQKDINSVYISCNGSFAADLHIRPDEITGRTDSDLFPQELAKRFRTDDERVLATGESLETISEYYIDAKTRWISIIRTPVRDRYGTITGIQGIFWDITEKKSAEEELRRLYADLETRVEQRTQELKQVQDAFRHANEKLNLLNSITRHDILNQLMVLKGYLELCTMPETPPADLHKYITRAQNVTATIEHMILFTREYQDIGVKSPAWQSVSMSVIRAKGALNLGNVDVVVDRSDLEVWADPLFDKVFFNLLDNALLYGGENLTTISIVSRESEGNLVLVFEDNGSGISDMDKARLFERGFGKHTGLGLYLSREILLITGITIAETGLPGTGARFEMTIPKGGWRYASDI